MDELYTIEGFKKNSLKHYGIKGQKWGVRRYQNPDGTLTPEGKRRYSKSRVKSGDDNSNRRILGSKMIENYMIRKLKRKVKNVDQTKVDKKTKDVIQALQNNDIAKVRTYMQAMNNTDFMRQMDDTSRRHNQWAMEQSRRAAYNSAMQSIRMANSMHPGF